jgi:hypothetical protein
MAVLALGYACLRQLLRQSIHIVSLQGYDCMAGLSRSLLDLCVVRRVHCMGMFLDMRGIDFTKRE